MIQFIKAVNLQSLEKATLMFPETGIVRLSGPNSNGKSIFRKAILSTIECSLHNKATRKALVRKGETSAQLVIGLYNGKVLSVNIALESSQTYYELMIPGKQTIRRYLADKELSLLIDDFGIHYSSKRNFSLNVCGMREPLFMVGTPGVTNFEQLDEISTDARTNAAIDNLTKLNSDLTEFGKIMDSKINETQILLSGLQVCDEEEERLCMASCDYLAENIKGLDVPYLPTISPVYNVEYISRLTPPTIPDVEPYSDVSGISYLSPPEPPELQPYVNVDYLKLLSVSKLELAVEPEILRAVKTSSELFAMPKLPSLEGLSSVAGAYHEIQHAMMTGTCPVCGKGLGDGPSATHYRQA